MKAKIVAICLILFIAMLPLILLYSAGGTEGKETTPSVPSATYEEELIDPSEWFDIQERPMEETTSPSTEPPTEPSTEPPTELPTEPSIESLGIFMLTAYCPCEECSGIWGNLTATETIAKPNHTIAVDPAVIPYGTKIKIGDIIYTAEDCGKSINGNMIDIFFETHEETVRFGIRYMEAFLVKDAE